MKKTIFPCLRKEKLQLAKASFRDYGLLFKRSATTMTSVLLIQLQCDWDMHCLRQKPENLKHVAPCRNLVLRQLGKPPLVATFDGSGLGGGLRQQSRALARHVTPHCLSGFNWANRLAVVFAIFMSLVQPPSADLGRVDFEHSRLFRGVSCRHIGKERNRRPHGYIYIWQIDGY